jgi:cell wall-associated NlpC family hydrolase
MIRLSGEDVLLSSSAGTGREIAEEALAMLDTPYLFGGRSSRGLDCSGLTGTCYGAAGLALPRDARQQALVGQMVATPWNKNGMRPGDLLFFINTQGRVIHTGIALGNGRFVHASPPMVQVNSLDSSDPLYSETWDRAFAFAKRPMP